MTIQGAMNELVNLLNADDIPIYYKGCIKKVIETIDDYIDGKDDYVKRRMEQFEDETPFDECKLCKFWFGYCHLEACDFAPIEDEPQTERSEQ